MVINWLIVFFPLILVTNCHDPVITGIEHGYKNYRAQRLWSTYTCTTSKNISSTLYDIMCTMYKGNI